MLDLHNRNIVALGAHPDDIELGCLGLLAQAQTLGSRITCVVMSCEDYTRRLEVQRALRGALGKETSIHCYRFPDGGLRCGPDTVEHVERHLDTADLVLTMTRYDTHQDHRCLERIATAACRRRPLSLLGYHSMSSTNQFPVDAYLSLDEEELARKLNAIACHRSQSARSYMQPEFLRSWHSDRTAILMGLERVELYHVYRLVEGQHVRRDGHSPERPEDDSLS